MRNNNIIALYSNVITDPETKYCFEAQFADTNRVDCQADAPTHTLPLKAIEMRKVVLHVGSQNDAALKRRFPSLYPYFNKHDVQHMGQSNTVQADVCVHLDPMFTEVLDLEVKIAVQAAEYKAARARDEQYKAEQALSAYTDLAGAYSKRVDDFNNLSVWTKLLHVVIAWFKDHKAV
ncbi:hypothetical protein [Vibrio phage vB_VpaS_CHI]|nr:hypothetical protein [Vibrio phage vB_VpaS_ALK]USL90084.1 hypothetical protein [Vibrio phage vB_VpaS_CHI]